MEFLLIGKKTVLSWNLKYFPTFTATILISPCLDVTYPQKKKCRTPCFSEQKALLGRAELFPHRQTHLSFHLQPQARPKPFPTMIRRHRCHGCHLMLKAHSWANCCFVFCLQGSLHFKRTHVNSKAKTIKLPQIETRDSFTSVTAVPKIKALFRFILKGKKRSGCNVTFSQVHDGQHRTAACLSELIGRQADVEASVGGPAVPYPQPA